ncbi:MAG: nuclear transport factor 2 family protein [Thermodesulfobacteriota bacterium]
MEVARRIATLRAAYEAFNRRDVDGVLALLASDVRWPDILQGRTLTGVDAVRAYWTRQFASLESRVEPERFVPDGDRVLVVVRQRVRRIGDGTTDERTVGHLYTFRAARIAAMEVHADAAAAERALREADAPPDVAPVVELVVDARKRTAADRSTLVALSGIDGSGKGWVTAALAAALRARGVRLASINVDGWLNLPQVRFATDDPAGHFYRHAIRFDELFAQLVLPLRERRSVRVEADFAEETATAYRKQLYAFEDVDVILLEGIYLLQQGLLGHYDLSVWIDCSFETALERALARGQEGLPPEDTIRAYRTIYFPAQEIHFERDRPREAASTILANDQRLAAGVLAGRRPPDGR